MHSSTVTVAVLTPTTLYLPEHRREATDFRLEWFSGTGAGGQHRNKHANSARIVHVPTGLVKTAQTRSRNNSQAQAMSAMIAELDQRLVSAGHTAVNHVRQEQIGIGERADRRRTWAFQRDQVDDHLTGKRMSCTKACQGYLDRLWPAAIARGSPKKKA